MGTWIKETDKAIYLMEGGYYRQKIDKSPRQGQVEGETFFRTQLLKEWLNRDDAPGFFLVSVGTGTNEPKPLPKPPAPPLPIPPTQ
ncbi:MAG: lysozyme, partial [Leptolyngbya sp. SIO3F4]|nr:lysozyme [Leptolyngbya sp. SIO3F4]